LPRERKLNVANGVHVSHRPVTAQPVAQAAKYNSYRAARDAFAVIRRSIRCATKSSKSLKSQHE
jgi:hypothetical protein